MRTNSPRSIFSRSTKRSAAGRKPRRRISRTRASLTKSRNPRHNNPMSQTQNKKRVIPGFGLSMGYTLFYLGIIVLVPLSTLFIKSASLSWPEFWEAVTSPRTLAAYRLSFGAAFVAAAINAVFGPIVAWVLVRYSFPGKSLVDALVDLPFALPTAVAGIALTAIYAPN